MANPSPSSKNTSRVILIIAGVLVLTSLSYFAYKYFSERQAHEEDIVKMEELNNEIISLEERLLDFEMTIDEKSVDLAEKSRMLQEKEEELKKLASKLQQSRSSNQANLTKIKDLEQRLEVSQRLLNQYTSAIEALKLENEQLADSVETLRDREDQLQAANQNLQQRQQDTEQQLEETTEAASRLTAREFGVARLRKNGKEREKVKDAYFKYSLRDLRICFTILANAIADAGPREVYLVYEGPSGRTYTSSASGSFSYERMEKDYTVGTQIDYNNLTQEVCLDFIRPDGFEYEKGPQFLSVYTDGMLIGQGSFTIK